MKKLAILTATAALALPAVAGATKPTTTHTHRHATKAPTAQSQCRTELKAMGKPAFRDLYGTNKDRGNAFGKCVSHRSGKHVATVDAEIKAAKACKTERAADPAAFTTKYGTSKTRKNAFGKCVAAHTKGHTTS